MNGCQEFPMSDDAPSASPTILIVKEKRCSKCGETKSTKEFHFNKSKKDGLATACKPCNIKQVVVWGQNNKEKKAAQHTRWYDSHKVEVAAKSKEWRKANPEIRRERLIRWRKANPEKRKAAGKRSIKKQHDTPQGRLNHTMSRSIWQALKRNKNGSWKDTVNYTLEELIQHLEKQFRDGMNWNNYGYRGWHIDHIIPKSAFHYNSSKDNSFKLCWSLENLQPLWAKENLSKNNRQEKEPWTSTELNQNQEAGG